MSSTATLNDRHAHHIISELVKNGVRHFLIAPGSRSTPLVLAAADNPLAQTTVHFDERGLAYLGLGMSKALNAPACLICTSGTALANFYPAIIEASMDHIPLIVLAGDRAPESLDNGSNQTIDHVKMFGSYLRYEFNLPCPDEGLPPEMVMTTVNHAYYRAISSNPGPVFLNVMFRKPLSEYAAHDYATKPYPYTKYYLSGKSLFHHDVKTLAQEFSREEKGIICVGKISKENDLDAIFSLALKLQWPIFADSLSGLRSQGRDSALIPCYNHLLKTVHTKGKLAPTTVLHLGGRLISDTLLSWIKGSSVKKYYHVADFPNRHDPEHMVTDRIEMSPSFFASFLLEQIEGKPASSWLGLWKEYSLHVEEMVKEEITSSPLLTESFAVHSLLALAEPETTFFFASSLPIRYADSFFFPKEPIGAIYANRGVSGIDGNIATIAGIAKASNKKVIAIIGDGTFLHDVNSLGLIKDLNVTLIVLNNQGGGLFHFLPVNQSKHLEKFFFAKHALYAEPFAKAFHIPYLAPKGQADYVAAVERNLVDGGPQIIEVFTNAKDNFLSYQTMEENIRKHMLSWKKEKELWFFTLDKK